MRESFPELTISEVCRLFGRTKQAFYQGESRTQDKALEDEIILSEVESIRKLMHKVGGRKLHFLLQDRLQSHGFSCGRDRLFTLLRDHNMLVKRRKRRPVTTDSSHGRPFFPNLLDDFQPDAPHQLWVCDITYVHTKDGFAYLSLITDGYSHKIVGYGFRLDLSTTGCLTALRMAKKQWPAQKRLIHHSDRGIQYSSSHYLKELAHPSIDISMSRKAAPQDNPIGERINGILKSEFGINQKKEGFKVVVKTVSECIDIYNNIRPHSSCDFLTPEQAHKETGILKKRW